MFDLISKGSFKRSIFWKYFFQIFVFPVLMGIVASGIVLIFNMISNGLKGSIEKTFEAISLGIFVLPPFIIVGVIFAVFTFFPNILSLFPFVGLIIDSLGKSSEVTKEIKVLKCSKPNELQCIKQSKRFLFDTFSKKKNCEMMIFDENGTKYRFFWNESYSSIPHDVQKELLAARQIKISYFRHSKIIFECEVTEKNLM